MYRQIWSIRELELYDSKSLHISARQSKNVRLVLTIADMRSTQNLSINLTQYAAQDIIFIFLLREAAKSVIF